MEDRSRKLPLVIFTRENSVFIPRSEERGHKNLPNDKFFSTVQIESICKRQYKFDLKIKLVMAWEENIVGKGENTGYRIFSFSHNVFKGFLLGSWKFAIVW